jgi:hypothetical protein
VLVSTDNGTTWSSITSGLSLHQAPISDVQVDPSDSRYLYAAVYGQGAWQYDQGGTPACPPLPDTPTPTVTVTRVPTPPPTPTLTPTRIPCAGDCDASGFVTIDEVLVLVNIALGNAPTSLCPAGDVNGDKSVTVDEILAAVKSALNGCPTVGAALAPHT